MESNEQTAAEEKVEEIELNDKTAAEEKQKKKERSEPSKFAQMMNTLYTSLSQLGEYFTHVFIKLMKFLGLCFMHIIAYIYSGFSYIKEPVGNFFRRVGETLASPFKRHRKARKLGTSEIAKARKEKGAWGVFCARMKVMWRTIWGKRGLLATAVNWGLPIISCIFLFNVISYANNQNYALKLTVNGDFVGYINDETTFTDAEKMVQNRINYTGSNTEVITFEPMYEVESIGNGVLLNQYQVADKMLLLLGKDVKEGYGLYLGDTYYGTLDTHFALDSAMTELLGRYSTGEEKEEVQFDKQISYIPGTYLADSFVNERDIINQFTSIKKSSTYYTIEDGDYMNGVLEKTGMTIEELASLNEGFNEDYQFYAGERLKITVDEPFLTVIVSREAHYVEEFDYEIQYVDDPTVYTGNTVTRIEGEKGERAVVANISYINGREINRRILSRTTVKSPVTKVVAIGSKPRTSTTAPGQTIEAGHMLWPVGANTGKIAENVWWKGGYYGHNGVDIMAPHGTPIYAAHNGVITSSVYNGGYNGGRGNYVVIQGDDGFTTYYYHCSAIDADAYVGRRVTAGDLIAYVGQTGRAWGNHLHFGVSIGNTYKDPCDYLL